MAIGVIARNAIWTSELCLMVAWTVAGVNYHSLSDQPVLNEVLREGQGHVEKWTMYAKGAENRVPELPAGKAQTCYQNILNRFEEECSDLEGEATFFFALELTNCFKIMHGEEPYECEKVNGRYPPLKKCTEDLMKNSDDRGTYHRNYNIAMSVCLYLQWKEWTHNTERIISALSDQASVAIEEIESVRSNIRGLSQSQEFIHDRLVAQKSSLDGIVNATSEIMTMQEDFDVVQKGIKSSADESLKTLSGVGSSLQALGTVRNIDSQALSVINRWQSARKWIAIDLYLSLIKAQEVGKAMEFQERMSEVLVEAKEKYERMEEASVKALAHTTESFLAIEKRAQEINATQMELVRATSESLTQNRISLDVLNRVFENLAWIAWTAKHVGMLAQLLLVYVLTIPIQLSSARGLLTLTCAFRFGGDLVLHKYVYHHGVPLQVSVLVSLGHLVVTITILCHAYCDFRSKTLRKQHSEALTERTYENINLLERKLVGFIDSQFEERMRNHTHDIKSTIQMEISRVGLDPLSPLHRRANKNIGYAHGALPTPEAISTAPMVSESALLRLPASAEGLPPRTSHRGKRKIEAPDEFSPVRTESRPQNSRSETSTPTTTKRRNRQSAKTPRNEEKDLNEAASRKDHSSPEDSSEQGTRRSARKRRSVYDNLNEMKIIR